LNDASNDPIIRRGTIMGGIAILLWSTTVAFSRSLTEQLGTLTAAAIIYVTAGILGLLATSLRPGGVKAIGRLPPLYLVGCGALFVIYIVSFYLALGLAENRTQVLSVGLINYLWPALSLVFSIPLLNRRARPLLPVGIVLAVAGTWLATTGTNPPESSYFEEIGSMLPYGLALVAAISWALYSNLSRRWAAGNDGGGVPIFLLASGLILGIMRSFSPETSLWSWSAGFELIYMAAFPGMIAYVLWDLAVRKGEIIFVASLSYLTPLLSTIISTIILDVHPGMEIWFGAGMVIAGALICKSSITDPEQASQ